MRLYNWDYDGSAVKSASGAEYKTVSLALDIVEGEHTTAFLIRLLSNMIRMDAASYSAVMESIQRTDLVPALYWRTKPEFEVMLDGKMIKLYARYVVDVDVEPDLDFVEWNGEADDLAVIVSGDIVKDGTSGARGIGDIP